MTVTNCRYITQELTMHPLTYNYDYLSVIKKLVIKFLRNRLLNKQSTRSVHTFSEV